MSIKVMNKVWDSGKHKGAKLLLLLAIADHSNEDGYCWPGIKSLSKKCRLSERHTRRLMDELIEEDEIIIVAGGNGRGNVQMLQMSSFYLEKGTSASQKGDTRVTPSYRTIINHKKGKSLFPYGNKTLTPEQQQMAEREARARDRMMGRK